MEVAIPARPAFFETFGRETLRLEREFNRQAGFTRGPTRAPGRPPARSFTARPRRLRMARGQRTLARPTLAFAPRGDPSRGLGQASRRRRGEPGPGRTPAAPAEVALIVPTRWMRESERGSMVRSHHEQSLARRVDMNMPGFYAEASLGPASGMYRASIVAGRSPAQGIEGAMTRLDRFPFDPDLGAYWRCRANGGGDLICRFFAGLPPFTIGGLLM
jgi:hypothetical protein